MFFWSGPKCIFPNFFLKSFQGNFEFWILPLKIIWEVKERKMKHSEMLFFSIRVFFHGHWRITGQQGKGGDHLLFHSTTSTRSRTFRHLFATLHVRWLSHIFNRTASIYQTATRWDLPPYRISFSFSSILLSPKAAKSMILQVLLFLSTATKSGLRASITWSVRILKCYKIL